MNNCKICNEDLYKDISIRNIFKLNYTVHDKCINNLMINNDRLVFPIENNMIYYDYIFHHINSEYNMEYLESHYLKKVLSRNLDNSDWSIIIYYEDGLFTAFTDNDKLILFSLANSPILVVSLIYYDLSSIFK